jgi:hypothetical protein
VSQEPRPDTIENEFGEAAGPIFQQHSTTQSGAEAYDAVGSVDPCEGNPSVSEGSSILEVVAEAVSATDSQGFLLGLIGVLARTARTPVDGESSLGTLLRHLGDALDEELDEEAAFQNLILALERRRFGKHALNEAVPVIAAFLARVLSEPILQATPGTTLTEIADLVRAAAQVAREALQSGGARSWRALPEIALTIAQRAARRNLSVVTLAEALPRLWTRLTPGSGEAAAAPAHPRARTTGEPRRMVISGPVEIVILER